MNYEKFFKDRVIIISGVGRSGTTILGKIVGSMKNCLYFFEPAIMKYFPVTPDLQATLCTIWNSDLKQSFLATLFEDYILPSVQGRNLNINVQDDSYWGHYQEYSDLRKRFVLTSRLSALKWLEKNKDIKFIFKVNESQYLYNVYADLFEGMKLLYVYRNGIDVVNSMIKKGWYKDDYEPIDIYETINGIHIPIWIKNNKYKDYINWNQETRCAYAWRKLNEIGMEYYHSHNQKNCSLYYYDIWMNNIGEFGLNNNAIKNLEMSLDLEKTELTMKHMHSMLEFSKNRKQQDRSIIDKIQEPERTKFLEYNKITSKTWYNYE